MGIKYADILNADADIIVIPVNTEGVMGAGLAKQFSIRFPEPSKQYRFACESPWSFLNMYGYEIANLGDGRDVLFFVTKKTWRENSTLAQLNQVFVNLRREEEFFAGSLVATPPLGAGLGKLSKHQVIPYVRRSFIQLGSYVDIYDLPINRGNNNERH